MILLLTQSRLHFFDSKCSLGLISMSYIQEYAQNGTKEQWSNFIALIKQLMMEENLNGSINLQFLSSVQNVQLFETLRTVKMSVYNAWEADDEERVGLLEGQPAEQLRAQREEKQVSTETFTQEIAHPSKQQENTIERTDTETIKENKSLNSQVHQTNESKSAIILLQNPKPQQSSSRQEYLQYIERHRMIQKAKREEFLARRQRQFYNNLNAQIKYLDDQKQERRKERQARQSGNFMQIIRQLFQKKKLTQ